MSTMDIDSKSGKLAAAELHKFLEAHRLKKGDDTPTFGTFNRMPLVKKRADGSKEWLYRPGKFHIPKDEMREFLDLYNAAFHNLPRRFNLTPKAQYRKMPFTIDIDLFCGRKKHIDAEAIVPFVTDVVETLDGERGRT